jgi:hypothetical protein
MAIFLECVLEEPLKVSRPILHGLLDKHGINAKDFR